MVIWEILALLKAAWVLCWSTGAAHGKTPNGAGVSGRKWPWQNFFSDIIILHSVYGTALLHCSCETSASIEGSKEVALWLSLQGTHVQLIYHSGQLLTALIPALGDLIPSCRLHRH